MPIIDVELVGPSPPGLAAQALADALGGALGTEPGRTWVRVRQLPRDAYAENECRPEDTELPVFVRILHAHPPTGPALALELAAITMRVAEWSQRPAAQVHVEYAPAGSGRQAFGGKLVE